MHAQALPALRGRNYRFGIENQRRALAFGIEIAAHDAIGKRVWLPVHALIGGKARQRVAVHPSLGSMTAALEACLDAIWERFLEGGFFAAKINIGHPVAEAAARVARTQEILGDSSWSMVGISGSCTADQAPLPIRVIERFGIHWVEEPLAPLDRAGYRWVRDRSPEPIAIGEVLCTAHRFNCLGVEGCAVTWQPGRSLSGGPSQGRLIARLADLYRKRLSPDLGGSGIGLPRRCTSSQRTPPTRRRRALPMRPSWNTTSPTIRCGTSPSPIRLCRSTASSPSPMPGIALGPEAVQRFSAEL